MTEVYPNLITIEDEYGPGVIIPHRSKKHADAVILVSPEDVDRVMEHRWSPVEKGRKRMSLYAIRWVHTGTRMGTTTSLHRFILELEAKDYRTVDHINHDGIDCRRKNMRIVTNQQNAFNSRSGSGSVSKHKGVSPNSGKGKLWRVVINHNQQCKHIGYFDDEIEAALAYDAAAIELFGEYAYLNFPNGTEDDQ